MNTAITVCGINRYNINSKHELNGCK